MQLYTLTLEHGAVTMVLPDLTRHERSNYGNDKAIEQGAGHHP